MYDKQKADQAVQFFRNLKHTKGIWRGVPFDLLPWQEKIIRDIFGTVKPDGYRQYNFVYVEVPKKNGKSELAAGVALKLLAADDEWGAEVYGCAADRAQASIVFDVAVDMVDQCPALKKRIRPVLSQKRLVYLPTKSFYQVLSAEAYSKHGLNVHGVIFDELHAQPTRELYDVMTKGSGDARTQPLFFIITTAGNDPDKTSIGWEVHKKAVDVLLGRKVIPNWYPVIFGIEPEENRVWKGWTYEVLDEVDWRDKKIWKMVNPSVGETITLETIENSYQDMEGNEAEERVFRQLRLNEWVKFKTSKWIPLEVWDKNNGMIIPEKLKGRKCYGGIDLSSKLDITAFVLVFPPEEGDDKYIILSTFWIPEDNMKERVKKDKVPYDKWVRQGYLKVTPGNVIDYRFIEQEIIKLRYDYDIQEIGYDPWNAQQTATNLEDEGFTMVPIRQGYKSMSPPMRELEALLKAGKINHGGNPVLRWMFGNLEVKIDENDNIRPVKGKSIERIDGIVALINAMARVIVHEKEQSPGVIFL
ncbi:MAG: terminase large subunit [Archaeoglobus sp.]|nr:terminase large subunit [Archaeoglobus sp.]